MTKGRYHPILFSLTGPPQFGEVLAGKRIINLRIPDKYQFQDPSLVDLLRLRLQEHLAVEI